MPVATLVFLSTVLPAPIYGINTAMAAEEGHQSRWRYAGETGPAHRAATDANYTVCVDAASDGLPASTVTSTALIVIPPLKPGGVITAIDACTAVIGFAFKNTL